MAGGLLSLAWWADGRPEAHRIATSTSAQGDAYGYSKCAGPCSQRGRSQSTVVVIFLIPYHRARADREPSPPDTKTGGTWSRLFVERSPVAWLRDVTAVAIGGGTWDNAWLQGSEWARERAQARTYPQ